LRFKYGDDHLGDGGAISWTAHSIAMLLNGLKQVKDGCNVPILITAVVSRLVLTNASRSDGFPLFARASG
jgi:hypothetical protein